MSANQKPDYRAAPVTQRDGSKLANSNCRMASISTGLDFDTLGAKKSTGAKMRAKQSDQEGGTDSGDAQRAWRDGYDENLDVQDGKTWADVLADLRRYRYVHIDVWHKTVGGPCLSGTGAYGHTMVIAPDVVDNNWLVSDPWCNPPKWSRVSEAKLKAGAEEWGRRVYGAATSGPGASDHPTLEQLRYAIKRLMSRYHPGDDGEEDPTEDPGDTGGVQRVMYTATTPHAPVVTPPPTTGGTTMGIFFDPARFKVTKDVPVFLDTSASTQVTTIAKGKEVTALGVRAVVDADGKDSSWRAVVVSTGALVPGDSPTQRAILWAKQADIPTSAAVPTEDAWDGSIWQLFGTPDGRFPCPPGEDCPDTSDVVAEAIAKRDGEWREWALEGSPEQQERSTMAAPSSVEDDDGDVN
jgi:hypothetical protein